MGGSPRREAERVAARRRLIAAEEERVRGWVSDLLAIGEYDEARRFAAREGYELRDDGEIEREF
jgi:hypothetical protein